MTAHSTDDDFTVYLNGDGEPEDRPESLSYLRAFVCGNQIAIVGPDFVNLQESDVIAWVPAHIFEAV